MPHNVSLPTHRYVFVDDAFVHRQPVGARVPAVWWGVSSDAGRALGCHVLLESGALVLDLPLHALSHLPIAPTLELQEVCAWDAFGADVELFESPYLSGLTATLLDTQHALTELEGELWFGVDWLRNGWSQYPEQHKHLWVVAAHDGTMRALPQDRLLVHEASFTEHLGVPPIARQRTAWSAER
jgi:hypothetical protein